MPLVLPTRDSLTLPDISVQSLSSLLPGHCQSLSCPCRGIAPLFPALSGRSRVMRSHTVPVWRRMGQWRLHWQSPEGGLCGNSAHGGMISGETFVIETNFPDSSASWLGQVRQLNFESWRMYSVFAVVLAKWQSLLRRCSVIYIFYLIYILWTQHCIFSRARFVRRSGYLPQKLA